MQEEFSERYSRQLVLAGFGEQAQFKLAAASVLVVGAGGLGCAALQYLTAAGVGTIGLADGDLVSLSNLQRQVLFTTAEIGKPKVAMAISRLAELNPEVNLIPHPFFLDVSNTLEVIRQYDIVIDATDNFPARYLLNDACLLTGKPLIHGTVSGFEGQLAVFNYGAGKKANYRDLFPEMPPTGEAGNCEEQGVLGVLPGIIGTGQAAEAIKIISGAGETLANNLLTINLLRNEWIKLTIHPTGNGLKHAPGNEAEFKRKDYGSAANCSTRYSDLSPEEFAEFVTREDFIIVDVRESSERPLVKDFPHINIPLSVLPAAAATYHNRSIILFCHSGIRSIAAAGYFPADNTIYNLKGGIIRWLNRYPSKNN